VIPKNSLVLGIGGDKYNPVNPKNTFPSWYIQDYSLWDDRTDDRRKDARAVVQYHPADNVMITVDDTYSDDHITANRFDYTTWFNAGRMYNVTQDSNGTITGFDHGPAPTDLDATFNGQYIQNNTLGLNVKWDITDQLATTVDVAQSSSHLNPNGELSQLQADIGYGPSYNASSPNYAANAAANFPNGYISGINVSNGSNILPVYSTYGPNNNQANALGLNPLILGSHVLPIGSQRGTDIVNNAKFDMDWHSGGTDLDGGLQFAEDSRHAYTLDTFSNNAWQLWNGYGPPSGNTNGQTLPLSALGNPSVINTSNFFPGFDNNNQLTPILQYNPWTVYNYLQSLGVNGANPNTISPVPPNCTAGAVGCYSPYTGGPEPLGLNVGSVSQVREKTYSPFVVVQQKVMLGDMPFTAKFGLRYEHTTVDTGGYGRLPTRLTVQTGDTTAFNFFYTPTQWLTASNSYHYILPSLDLNLSPIESLKVRFDASRTLTRPPLNEITPTLSVGGRVGALTATGNNPGLLPYLSNNFDLGAEWYYGQNEYLALDTFFKHVSQFPQQQVVNTNINGVQDPTTGAAAVWAETTFVNAPSANVYGAEMGWQHMIGYGFGTQINGTVVHTNEPYQRYSLTTHFYLPGLANSANFVGFYQNYGFQARIAVNWTAEQLISTVQEQSGGQFGNEPVFTRPFTEVDFSAQYDINQHVSVFFKALNLSDSEVVEHGRFSNQILNVQDIGRTFTMGVRAKL
jgi:TonB-dependent receptor